MTSRVIRPSKGPWNKLVKECQDRRVVLASEDSAPVIVPGLPFALPSEAGSNIPKHKMVVIFQRDDSKLILETCEDCLLVHASDGLALSKEYTLQGFKAVFRYVHKKTIPTILIRPNLKILADLGVLSDIVFRTKVPSKHNPVKRQAPTGKDQGAYYIPNYAELILASYPEFKK